MKQLLSTLLLFTALLVNAQNNTFKWAKAIGGNQSAEGQSITIDANGNVYTTGYFNGTADFDPGAGIANLTSVGGSDIFVSKLDANGNYVWAKAIGRSGGGFSVTGIVVDASGALVANQAVGVKISLLQGSATGTAVYVETQNPTTNANGLASFQIGGLNNLILKNNITKLIK